MPTLWLAAGSRADLRANMRERNWRQAVIKPVVSAAAFGTLFVTQDNLDRGQAHLDALLAEREMLVQPFLNSVETYGEPSFMFIGGQYSHAVIRHTYDAIGAGSELRIEPLEPPEEVLALAERALAVAGYTSLYARVDLVYDNRGKLCLMELELVEPSLFLGYSPQAMKLFSRAIAERL